MREKNRYLQGLVAELRKLPAETQWVEFKHNNDNPQDIGEYISALSNAAALEDKQTRILFGELKISRILYWVPPLILRQPKKVVKI